MLRGHLDFFSVLIFLGVIQGFIISGLFIFTPDRKYSNTCLGLLTLTLTLISFEIFLCYTNYITSFLYLVDYSEFLNFAIGPLFYYFIYSQCFNRLPPNKFLHFIPLILYFFYSFFFFVQNDSYKYNAFLSAYYPGMRHIPAAVIFEEDPLGIKKHVNFLTICHIFIYISISAFCLWNKVTVKGARLLTVQKRSFSWLLILTIQVYGILLLWTFSHTMFNKDLGDHFLASYISIVIYTISFFMLRNSSLLKADLFERKYAKSNLSASQKLEIKEAIEKIMREEEYFTNHLASLPGLSKKIHIPTYQISEVLSQSFNKTFFELLSEYRIKKVIELLSDPESQVKIDEISYQSGFNSKSVFNNSFKKITGLTPSAFRKNIQT